MDRQRYRQKPKTQGFAVSNTGLQSDSKCIRLGDSQETIVEYRKDANTIPGMLPTPKHTLLLDPDIPPRR